MLMTAEKAAPRTAQAVDKSWLSQKPIPRKERLIFALDVSTREEAEALVEQLGDSVSFYKLGLQLFMAGGYYELIQWLRERGKQVFVDLKFFDVPETIRLAVSQLKDREVYFATVHGNEEMLRAALQDKNGLRILAVTVLTSLDNADLKDLGFDCDTKTLVLSRARRALEIGCDGVISSGIEAAELRQTFGDKFLIVSPAIRPMENRTVDDQKRIVTPEQAFLAGADYIVVGRPIRDAKDPRAAAEKLQRTIESLFEK